MIYNLHKMSCKCCIEYFTNTSLKMILETDIKFLTYTYSFENIPSEAIHDIILYVFHFLEYEKLFVQSAKHNNKVF